MTQQSARLILVLYLLAGLCLVACGRSDPPTPTINNVPTDTPEATDTETPPTDTPNVDDEPTATTAAAETDDEPTATPAPADSLITNLPTSTLFETAWDDRSSFSAGLIAAEQGVLDELPGASVYHIAMQLDESLRLLQGQEEVRYTNQEAVALNELYFHLFPNLLGGRMVLSGITINGADLGLPAEYEAGETAVGLPLPQALQPGEQVVVHLDFLVEIPDTPGTNYGAFAYLDGVLALANFYPQIAVYDDEGWNIVPPPPNADPVYADSSFYLVRVAAPAGLTLVTSGNEIEQEETGDQQTVTFAAGPVRDFYLVTSADFVKASGTAGETTVNTYTLSQFAESGEAALDYAAASIATFSERIGAYPFTEFDLVSTNNLALGIEYPGIVVLTLRLYDPATDFGGVSYLTMMESVTAHEAGHQWFYSAVGNDQLDEPWLDESLTQYITYLYFVDNYGANNAQGYYQSFDGRWARVEYAEMPVGLPAAAYEGNAYSAIVYGRGPIFFNTLAEEMGQETFDAFLSDYFATYKWGIASGDALKQLAEEHCGCDLTDLFEEWIFPQN